MEKTVLVIDDSVTIRLYYRGILEQAGYTVEQAANGYEGIEKALLHPFALFIVDINMPIMDGYTFLRKVRDLTDVPAIMISNESEERDVQRAYEAGASIYIVKPVEPAELLLHVNMLIGQKS
ncbi:MAG: response regulator [Pseudomonadota bacterium]